MKSFTQKILKVVLLITIHFSLFTQKAQAQAPQKFSYQAVVRNASNALVVNSNVGIQVRIRNLSATGTIVYEETHTATTNVNGLASIQIGGGTVTSGTFASINWASGDKFINTNIDPTGGTNYTIMSTTQLLSVPYALSSADNKWTASGNNISNNNTGNLGIGTVTPTTKLEVNGFTKLGSDAPAIKVKKLTATTASTQDWYSTVSHGLDSNKILSVSVFVNLTESGIDTRIPSNYHVEQYKFSYAVFPTAILILNVNGSSANILSKPVTIYITYEE